MFNFNSQKRREKKFIDDYSASILELIDLVIDKCGDKYDIIKNDKEIFRYEYTILIFWLTIQKFANISETIR
ncbi:hypothetical protein KAS41_02720 [Candidatus Parcubacteria bacterium]|nr:hypothetical protein [Candidatus Parcubacteria bacterium]